MTKKLPSNLGLLFYEVAGRRKDATAIRYPSGKTISYQELNNRSNQIARLLRRNGVQERSVVGIFNNKSTNAYASMLACIKIGAIYTNLDINSPWKRTNKIIKNCNPSLILDDGAAAEMISAVRQNNSCPAIDISDRAFQNDYKNLDQENLCETEALSGSNPAYLMFTSGSTGFPKGAVITHDNVLNFINWCSDAFSINEKDVLTNVSPMYFDNSVFDFFNSLFTGATMASVQDTINKNPQDLVSTVNALKCTIWYSVPSLLVYLLTAKALKKSDFTLLTRIVFAGEGFPKPKLKQLFELYCDRMTLFNCYGPTETTCLCSSYKLSKDDFEDLNELTPLGFMAPSYKYIILPVDESNLNFGELCLMGPGVGAGYYNDDERTRESFVQNPLNQESQEIMYKTGDLVRRAENGFLHFKGRKDNQIKHMGYRIELEEIEAGLNSLKYVDAVGVVYKHLGSGLGMIVAFVSISTKTSESEIIDDIKKIVPRYMVPKSIKIQPSLPKNRNGKIDRRQLEELL